ncbi:S1 family peptidase [Streptomyces boninensis]|uniref:S1 family peptidase n=1 Tax=Streptomyces boninensis TaxID=2039455 RepID=UPI003B20D5BB
MSPTATAGPRQNVVRGGDVLYGAAGACTVGFNADDGTGEKYGLLLGHCAGTSDVWYADSARTVQVGVTAGVVFPGGDFAVVRYTNTAVSYPGEVAAGDGVVDITGAADPYVGEPLCHFGRAGGLQCGTVVALNSTISYPEGTVTGLFSSNACSEPGDLGGPAFDGGTALGLIAGGSGCSGGGTTYYQPITEILEMYGLSVN